MEFLPEAAGVYTTELWYDLFDGGYIDPKLMLKDQEDIDKVCGAIDIVKEFINQAIYLGIIEVE